ncbi:2-isopropylmalate synthase [Bacillus lacus]|uniref:2-isopropylmalate synthase n=1 Tax=Metabacillus lacus TaxID=1983721 RepID=A0A7X2M0J0_9BACI|nr:2-isopropylmalate synthase [Metabacillus lacus]
MQRVNIFDTTLRDGEQSAGVSLNPYEKLEIAKQLEKLGVDIMEAGFPASSKGDFHAVKEIAGQIRSLSVTGLARSVQGDIDAAWEALKEGAYPRIHLFLATSDIHMQYKLKMTPQQVIETAVASVHYASQLFPVIQWSAEDACRTKLPFLAEIVERVISAGATVINIPDTVGYISPAEYGKIFSYLKENVPNIHKAVLSAHCHDDLGMATSNSLAAIQHGAGQVECTVNGIGERAGNASLEEIAVSLHIRKDYYRAETAIKLEEIKKSSDLVGKLTGMVVPPNKAVVGRNAFAHESGIHQDGVLKEKTTYEIITPQLVGVNENSLVLGKHSGRHAFGKKLMELGFDLQKEELNQLFSIFKKLSEKKKEFSDEDITALVFDEKFSNGEAAFELLSLQVHYGSSGVPAASVTLKSDKGMIAEAATGGGSVEAIYATLERCTGVKIDLLDYRIQSNGGGKDAFAQVFVRISMFDKEISGRGIAQDVLEASAKAYLHAVNKYYVKFENSEGLKATI